MGCGNGIIFPQNTQWFDAAINGNNDFIAANIQKHSRTFDPRITGTNVHERWGAIHYAAERQNMDMMDYLLETEGDLITDAAAEIIINDQKIKIHGHSTIAHILLAVDAVDIIEILFEEINDHERFQSIIGKRNDVGQTAMFLCPQFDNDAAQIWAKNPRVIRAEISRTDNKGKNFIMQVIQKGCVWGAELIRDLAEEQKVLGNPPGQTSPDMLDIVKHLFANKDIYGQGWRDYISQCQNNKSSNCQTKQKKKQTAEQNSECGQINMRLAQTAYQRNIYYFWYISLFKIVHSIINRMINIIVYSIMSKCEAKKCINGECNYERGVCECQPGYTHVKEECIITPAECIDSQGLVCYGLFSCIEKGKGYQCSEECADPNAKKEDYCKICKDKYVMNNNICVQDNCSYDGKICNNAGTCKDSKCECDDKNADPIEHCSKCKQDFSLYEGICYKNECKDCLSNKCQFNGVDKFQCACQEHIPCNCMNQQLKLCNNHGICTKFDKLKEYRCECKDNRDPNHQCDTCVNNYALHNDTCISKNCIQNDIICGNVGQCLNNTCKCEDKYADPQKYCLMCLIDYEMINGTCFASNCIFNNQICANNGTCDQKNRICQCNDKYSNPQNQCQQCYDDYQKVNNTCFSKQCVMNSIICGNAGICDNQNQTCICNDKNADPQLFCLDCLTGFEMFEDVCISKKCLYNKTICGGVGECKEDICVCKDKYASSEKYCLDCIPNYTMLNTVCKATNLIIQFVEVQELAMMIKKFVIAMINSLIQINFVQNAKWTLSLQIIIVLLLNVC
ncbi:Tenascin-like_protein [Hexamita inflata]|uniref:Tenascin-like protein n=1 Tax=Hexamita inflata TaxID=28002 RepID=A0AA86V726_9EUKA|nr:Tenascin-like protein [Hexamita inflata]